jgi:hypothetical protein
LFSALSWMLYIAYHWSLQLHVCRRASAHLQVKYPTTNSVSRVSFIISPSFLSHFSLNIQEVSRFSPLSLAQGAVLRQAAWQQDPERTWQRPCELTPEYSTASFVGLIKSSFADIHYYYGPPTAKPPHHRFDKGSYVYLFENAAQRRARLEVANNAGTPEQDAFNGCKYI